MEAPRAELRSPGPQGRFLGAKAAGGGCSPPWGGCRLGFGGVCAPEVLPGVLEPGGYGLSNAGSASLSRGGSGCDPGVPEELMGVARCSECQLWSSSPCSSPPFHVRQSLGTRL